MQGEATFLDLCKDALIEGRANLQRKVVNDVKAAILNEVKQVKPQGRIWVDAAQLESVGLITSVLEDILGKGFAVSKDGPRLFIDWNIPL